MHRESSAFIRHVPCDACGSRDNAALYDDGHTYCHGCGAFCAGDGETPTATRRKPLAADIIRDGLEVKPLLARKITQETAAHFGYACGTYKGKPVQVAPYYDADGHLVAQKVRFPDKSFIVTGDISKALPFGANAFPKTGKKIVVTEGEIDALSMSQVQGNSWPTVSISCGADKPTDADGKPLPMRKIRNYFAEHRAYFLGFDEVVLMFDMDEQGRASARVAAEVIGAGRAKIADLPQGFKDANEMLQAGKTKELIDAMWRAQEYRPDGIVDLASLKEKVKERPAQGIPWWSPSLTDLTYGIRLGEIYAFGAGTGVGKTDFFTQEMADLVTVQKQSIGVFYLEQQPVETATRLAGKVAQIPLHIPDSWDERAFDSAWDKLNPPTGPKVYLYDNFGACEWDSIREKIEYLVHAHGVRYIFLDHLTALAAAEEDERIALEKIMADMGALVKRLGIALFLISHLATPEKGSHEEGARVTIRQFKGSRAIGFWCHFMFGLERNQQSDDENERTTTTFRVLKDRYTGRATGKTFALGYDSETGLLFEKPFDTPTSSSEGFTDNQEEAAPSDF